MNIVLWLIIGMGIGIFAYFLEPKYQREGMLGSILLGSAGAVIAVGFALLFFGINTAQLHLPALAVAIFGAFVLLLMGNTLKHSS